MVFLNLTNGLEYTGEFDGFVRIQSTLLEQKRYSQVIEDLDYNFLLSLVAGKHVYVVDYSAKKKMSRALFQGITFIKYSLEKACGLVISTPYIKNVNVSSYFATVYSQLSDRAKAKLRYVSKFCDTPIIKVYSCCYPTSNDGNLEFHKKEFFKKMKDKQ